MWVRVEQEDFLDLLQCNRNLREQVAELQARGTELVEDNRNLKRRLDSAGGKQPERDRRVDSREVGDRINWEPDTAYLKAWAETPCMLQLWPKPSRDAIARLPLLIYRLNQTIKYGLISTRSPEWRAFEAAITELLKEPNEPNA